MGVDIYAREGVAVSVDKLIGIVTEENKAAVCRMILRYTAKLVENGDFF